MGRKKVIEDDVLHTLLENFYEKECHCNANLLRLPQIAEYVRCQGYSGYTVENLRRNPMARNYVNSKKQTAEDARLVVLVNHKPIDIDAFLTTYPTRNMLRKGLAELDGYYGNLADAATSAIRKYNALMAELNTTTEALKQAQEENADLKKALYEAKKNVAELKARVCEYKGIVYDYVYSGIANELLYQDGVLSEANTGIDPDKLGDNIIKSGTVVDSQAKLRSGSSVLELFAKKCDEE